MELGMEEKIKGLVDEPSNAKQKIALIGLVVGLGERLTGKRRTSGITIRRSTYADLS